MKSSHLLSLVLAIALCNHASTCQADQNLPSPEKLLRAPFLHPPAPQVAESDLQKIVREFAPLRDTQSSSQYTPVVIIPALTGSKLFARLDGATSRHWYCWTHWKQWFLLWVNWVDFLGSNINCWYERMTLDFDEETGRSFNATGVKVDVLDYGGIDSVNYIDTAKTMGLWNTTIDILSRLGWTTGKNLRSAPYDWRLGPQNFLAYEWPRLRSLIEETYELNNNTKVACVSLSMGGLYFVAFLNQQSQEWKDKYIDSFISLDGAFGGSSSAVTALISSLALFPDADGFRKLAQSLPSFIWLLPSEELYSDHVWVTTLHPPRNYTTQDFVQLFLDANAVETAKIFKNLRDNKWYSLEPPGVEVHNIIGTGVPTPSRTIFNTTEFAKEEPIVEFTNGDATIPDAGLRLPEQWRSAQTQPIYTYHVEGLIHGSSPSNLEVIRLLLRILI